MMIINERTGNIFYDEELPKKEGFGANKGKILIDWKNSVGVTFSVLYFNNEYKLKISKYIKEKQYLILEYNGMECKPIKTGHVTKSEIGAIIGKITSDFKVEIGSLFKDDKRYMLIVDREYRPRKTLRGHIIKEKFYKYICKNESCNNSDWIAEDNLINKNVGCNVCGNHPKKVTSFNCVASQKPELLKYFVDKNDAYTNMCGSKTTVECVCNICNSTRKLKISFLASYGFVCKVCSDNISYPNKLMMYLLKELCVDFVREYSPKYLNRKISDFYLPHNRLIIEMDGRIGHEGGVVHSKSEKTLDELIAIDKWKDEQHLLHGVKTIRINCFESNVEYIRENILKSELVNYFDFDKMDWDKIELLAIANIKLNACEYKRDNPNATTRHISDIFNISITTARSYLTFGNKVGICEYVGKDELIKNNTNNGIKNAKNQKTKKVEVFKNDISLGVFESAIEIERNSIELFGVKLNNSNICLVCLGRKNSYKGYTFKYITKEECQERIKNSIN